MKILLIIILILFVLLLDIWFDFLFGLRIWTDDLLGTSWFLTYDFVIWILTDDFVIWIVDRWFCTLDCFDRWFFYSFFLTYLLSDTHTVGDFPLPDPHKKTLSLLLFWSL
uniref:Uncharacterized protein n=1 Tax=Pneumocystis oryctolagi TaxID=42067 RepID=A0A8A6W3W0_9ASCO|nr:hypothetical protein MFU99_mgp01 [Pneumocystis oryctolagi]YP_010248553.1 hypothetical protein MFU99_mgp02 [Pneumocystis oryctolagi]QTK22301.1 hypothetical protein [Pneumocystis oryctolagi]QTK22317.1 hypothetical protein [Pneumocystis oryctolagi]